jgi:TPP-dependent indolepyruvate ferredoxin oxidoreductase alpha subunit
MSTLGDVLSGVKKVLLLEESVARIEKNFDKLGEDVRRTRDYADSIDRRVTRLEGFIEGATAASGQQARLPKE